MTLQQLGNKSCYRPICWPTQILCLALFFAVIFVFPIQLPAQDVTGTFNENGSLINADVDPAMGSLLYQFPFGLSPARGNAKPVLALAYNSSSGDGEAGMGWRLNLPVIERRPLSGWPSYDDTKDRFAYEGRSLVFLCITGQATCPSDEVPPVVGWRYYRMQVEGGFLRFFLNPGGTLWIVQHKGGRVQGFGIFDAGPSIAFPLLGVDRETPQQIFRWKLVLDVDSHGNGAVYRWQTLGVRQLSYLTDIYDTSQPLANIPEGPVNVKYAHHTQLWWEPSGLRVTTYAHIDRAYPDLRLARVAVASATWMGQGEREVIRAYALSYMDPRSTPGYIPELQAPLWGHYFLKSIELEGNCGRHEINGEIPRLTGCPKLPPTTFGYQTGVIPIGQVTALSRVTGAPPDANDTNFKLLSDVRTAAVMDINRDGLPDVVQSWPADAVIDLTNHPELRGQSALLNVGNDGVSARFQHQCIDTGTAQLHTQGGLAEHNLLQQAAFLSPFHGASILGAWGGSLLLWNQVDYAPVALLPTAAEASFCPAATADPPDPKHPAWFWSPNSQLGWLRSANSPGGNQPNRRWFVDVDGDGLPDEFNGVGGPAPQDLELSHVDFTRRVTGSESPTGKPALVPFVSNLALVAESLAPSPSPRSNTRFYYADVNGDGLVDLVLYNPDDNGGNPRVRFGDGRGVFACVEGKQPELCRTGSPVDPASMLIDVPDAKKPWPFVPDTYFHDVTGDGLADIVQLELGDGTGRVKLWINQDGRTFRCAAPENDCVVGRFFDDLHGTFKIQPARVTFADMNANGVDDIVVLNGAGVLFLQVVQNTFPGIKAHARAPRPGLLIRLNNGHGATREIEYQTIQELERAAVTPWNFHSPEVAAVVTGVAVRNTETAVNAIPVKEPFLIDRWTTYSYRDPAYDKWERRFMGFRKVTKQHGAENSMTETTYIFGPCQREIKDCPDSSDDDHFKAMEGRPVRVEQSSPANGGIGKLSITLYDYTNGSLFDTERHVWFAYASSRRTFLYDTEVASKATTAFHFPGSPDLVDGPNEQNLSPQVLDTVVKDNQGELVESIQHGRVTDSLEPIDEPLKTTIVRWKCTASWKCNARTLTTEVPGSFNRQSRYMYNADDDLSDVESLLAGSAALQRKPAVAGAAIAKTPLSASTDGWKKLLHLDYDGMGNVTRAQGPGSPEGCMEVEYDQAYRQFPQRTSLFTAGCAGGKSLTTVREFDRGTGRLTREVAPNGAATTIEFDGFGRPRLLNVPNTDGPPGTTAVAERYTYRGADGLFSQVTEKFTDPSAPMLTVDYPNALGEPILTFTKADISAGDAAPWILSGPLERDSSGRIVGLRRAAFFSDDALDGTKIRQQVSGLSGGVFEIAYDAFGRTKTISENSIPVARYRYKPLQLEMLDAEQLKIGGQHAAAFSRTEMDGHQRTVRLSQITRDDTLSTERKYLATGEPVRIVQSHSAGVDQVIRTMEYDSFGRMTKNLEPNTSTSAGGLVTYVWDDANQLVGTSDARGCGENRFYDGIGRLLAEDYSPCRIGQPAYTEPDLTTGNGTEAFFRYDVYEPGQLSSNQGFADTAENAAGMMTADINRGAYTRLNYDSRGNLRLLSRRIAKPGKADNSLIGRFSNHEFFVRSDYDLADRLIRQTTGADAPGLLAGGASEERYKYSARGLPLGVDSPYGTLSTNTRYDAEGLLLERILGDAAHTKEIRGYDEKKRLATKKLERAPTPLWTTASPTYELPGAATTQLQLENLEFTYDNVGNPTNIADTAADGPWPEGAKPSTRKAEFDDLYRLNKVGYLYAGSSAQISPFASESALGDTSPIPVRSAANRVRQQSFNYDWKGGFTSTADDQNILFDRSLGNVIHSEVQGKPNQLQSAGNGALRARYDDAGNLVDLVVERSGSCPVGSKSQCAQRFVFDWDEVGQLMQGRRWDFTGPSIPATIPVYPKVPKTAPAWQIQYAYSDGARVLQSATAAGTPARQRPRCPLGNIIRWIAGRPARHEGVKPTATRHSVDVFGSLRLADTTYDAAAGDYARSDNEETAYLGGVARVIHAPALPSPDGSPLHVLLDVADQLGSTSHVIDAKSGEVVERTTYQAYGATESDYRPERWKSFREDQKYNGKEDDKQLGLTYYGVRYYHPRLGQWISPDPLTVHGAEGDLNPYAFVGGRVLQVTDPWGLEDTDKSRLEPGDPIDTCAGSEVCLPPDQFFEGRQTTAPIQPSSTASPDTPPAPVQKTEIGTAAAILNEAQDLVSRAADLTIGSPEATHIRVGNVWKETANLAVDALPWWIQRQAQGLKFNVKEEEGDVSYVGPLIASAIIPVGGGAKVGGGAAKIAENALSGRGFERAALRALGAQGSKKLVARLFTVTIPDAVSKFAVVEIKNWAEIYITRQLRAQIAYAATEKSTYVLVVNMETKVAPTLVKVIERVNGLIVRFDPLTGGFHPF